MKKLNELAARLRDAQPRERLGMRLARVVGMNPVRVELEGIRQTGAGAALGIQAEEGRTLTVPAQLRAGWTEKLLVTYADGTTAEVSAALREDLFAVGDRVIVGVGEDNRRVYLLAVAEKEADA